MKVLFFAPAFVSGDNGHNGGGWISSLLSALRRHPEITCGVCFEGHGQWGKVWDGVTCYPVAVFGSRKNRLLRKFDLSIEERLWLPEMQRVIADFQPDLIHIFGSENPFGIICGHTDLPCIIHLQGFLPSYYNAKLPPAIGDREILRLFRWHPVTAYHYWWKDKVFKYRAKRELRIIRQCRYFMGRTAWDRGIISLYHPEAEYFTCQEMLRESFYKLTGKWHIHGNRECKTIVSVLSSPLYKGHDLILKTAALLKQYGNLAFTWKIFGAVDLRLWENLLHISAADVNVQSCGTVSAEKLTEELQNADLYVHPSYIDNSPNSVCEAQLMGVPVLAADVGGVASLIENNVSGLLVPANDPVMLAVQIRKLLNDSALAERLGKQGAAAAGKRHEPDSIIHSLGNIYQQVIKEK